MSFHLNFDRLNYRQLHFKKHEPFLVFSNAAALPRIDGGVNEDASINADMKLRLPIFQERFLVTSAEYRLFPNSPNYQAHCMIRAGKIPFFLTLIFLCGMCHLSGTVLAQPEELIEIRQDIDAKPLQYTDADLNRRFLLLIGYSCAIVLASIVGGYLPSRIKLTHTRMQLLMSFVGGLMLGVALFHLLLHAVIDSDSADLPIVMTGVGLGILIMFLLLRAFHFHQHDVTIDSVAVDHVHGECDHAHDHLHVITEPIAVSNKKAENPSRRKFSWIGIALGLGLHTVLDGVALAASCLRSPGEGTGPEFWGLATFLAVLLHKPLDAISITTVMASTGWKPASCTIVNISFAIMCPIGAFLAWWGILGLHSHAIFISYLMAFSAGVFLCISLSDLLPEMQFHAHNQWALTFTLLAGMVLAWSLMFLDPVHPPL